MPTHPSYDDRLMARAIAIAQAITMAESAHLQHVKKLQGAVMQAADAGMKDVQVTLSVPAWLAIIDEIKDRRPRNYSMLLADEIIDRLELVAGAMELKVFGHGAGEPGLDRAPDARAPEA
jgi:hypothetical protein